MESSREPLRITKLYCYNCGHIWKPRIEVMPICCPYCKSHNWRSKQAKDAFQSELGGVYD